VITRQSVDQPVQTGLKAIDAMVPVGRGQRELIIGDRQTGKTAVAIDAIINQKGTGIKCIYVAVGQKASSIANVVRKLEEHGAMEHTIVVAASASESAAMQFIAPYAGCTMGEYFRDRGEDALIIYDDLTKQAWAYRQVSLLLRARRAARPIPVTSSTCTRVCSSAPRGSTRTTWRITKGEVKGKTGSLTALPIIETQAGDVSAFVPTNVISITDGQIFLETDLFNAGIRPAINAGLSVSAWVVPRRPGSSRSSAAACAWRWRSIASSRRSRSSRPTSTRPPAQLERGQRVMELMKQKQYSPMSVAQQAVSLFAVDRGYLDDIELDKVGDFEAALQSYMASEHGGSWRDQRRPGFNDEVEAKLKAALDEFKSNHLVAEPVRASATRIRRRV
jgi:F-type H+/Na+-transporting ATPase subunit alpha